jgi:predicted nucleic-acid-binding Zn-ribbon protein
METPNSNNCRNCGSAEPYWEEVSANGGYGACLLPLGMFSNAKFQICVCGNCGLVEWFVAPHCLDAVKKKFLRGREAL